MVRVRTSLLAALVVVIACASPRSDPAARDRELVVFAAASLREPFSTLGDAFRRTHPGVKVTFAFAGTQELRAQLEHGAAADVLASADLRHMDELVRERLASTPVVFARNEPVLVIARDSAGSLRNLADLPAAERVIIGAPEVPIGRYTLQLLDRAGATLGRDFRSRVEAKVVSRELDVRQVLNKVSLGEAQAGVVYRSDVMATGARVAVVSIPADINVMAEYPIAVLTGAPHPLLAQQWVSQVLSPEGQRVLSESGFLAPRGGEHAQ